ncbi:unnamed protein product [Polarella glacialis]|uniref:Uncharacterized protein n=1 Tax=Polarella glacialis TaxID=89957 RepID=A0A813L3U2_POLGL|nr:unnamed protein product [Polarella glacialis]
MGASYFKDVVSSKARQQLALQEAPSFQLELLLSAFMHCSTCDCSCVPEPLSLLVRGVIGFSRASGLFAHAVRALDLQAFKLASFVSKTAQTLLQSRVTEFARISMASNAGSTRDRAPSLFWNLSVPLWVGSAGEEYNALRGSGAVSQRAPGGSLKVGLHRNANGTNSWAPGEPVASSAPPRFPGTSVASAPRGPRRPSRAESLTTLAVSGTAQASTPGLYVCGGHASGVTLDGVERLNPGSGRWEVLPPMPTPRHGCAAASVIGILYVFGGANDSGLPLDTAERFDPLVRCWDVLPPVPTARHGAACAAVAGILYVIGGYDGEGVLAATERFDPASKRWETLPPMPTPRGRCAAAALDGLIFVAGGTDDDAKELDSLERLDPSSWSWQALPSMPTPRCGCAVAAMRGSLYVLGGRGGSEKLSAVERYDLATGCWESVTAMPTARDGCAAASSGEAIYVFGGRGIGQTLPVAECYDPRTGLWEQLPPMPHARCGCSAAAADR